MTEERAAAYRALLSQALSDGDFFAVRGRQGDKAIANRFYNLLPLIAELREADRGAKGTAMNDKALVSEERVLRACNAYDAARDGEDTAEYPAMHAALEAALGVGGWRPIAEAPKDGRGLLGWFPGSRCTFCMYWNDVWNEWQSFGGNGGFHGEQPAKFQPLPPPPSSEEG